MKRDFGYKTQLAGPRGMIDSNRIFWLMSDKEREITPDFTKKEFHDKDRSIKALKRRYKTINDLRQDVRQKANTLQKLSSRMNYPPAAPPHQNGNRNRIANFTTVARPENQPKTTEFRQARGSLCAEEVMHSVKFCIGLVRLAQLYHNNPDKFPIKNWENERDVDRNWERGDINVFDLIEDMKLGDDEKKYWRKRLALWQAGEPGDADDRTDNE